MKKSYALKIKLTSPISILPISILPILILLGALTVPILSPAFCKIISGNTIQYMQSSSLTTRIKQTLAYHLGNETLDSVVVTAYLGDVQLTGFLNSKEEIRTAVELTKSIDGVDNVQNDLLV